MPTSFPFLSLFTRSIDKGINQGRGTANESGGSGPIIGPVDGGTATTPSNNTEPLINNPHLVYATATVNGEVLEAKARLPESNPNPDNYTFAWTAGAGVNFISATNGYSVQYTLDDVADGQKATRVIQCDVVPV